MWGQPFTPWWLYLWAALDPGPFAGLGLLWLDVSDPSFVVLGSGMLPVAGHAAVTTGVPPDPSLVGMEVYGQALVGWPPRLTNVQETRLHAY